MTDNFMNQLKKELMVIHDSINNYGKYPETGNSKYHVIYLRSAEKQYLKKLEKQAKKKNRR